MSDKKIENSEQKNEEISSLLSLMKSDGSFPFSTKIALHLRIPFSILEEKAMSLFKRTQTNLSLNDVIEERTQNFGLFISTLVFLSGLLENNEKEQTQLKQFLERARTLPNAHPPTPPQRQQQHQQQNNHSRNVPPRTSTPVKSQAIFWDYEQQSKNLSEWFKLSQRSLADMNAVKAQPTIIKGRPTLRSTFMMLARENEPERNVVDRAPLDPLPTRFPLTCHPLAPLSNLPKHMTQMTFGWCEGNCENAASKHSVLLEKQIYAGQFASIFSGQWDGQQCAAKVFPAFVGEVEQSTILNEIDIPTKLGTHPNLVSVLTANIRPPNYCIVFEFLELGDLETLIHQKGVKFDLACAVKIGQDIAIGMAFLHKKNYIHRDLKTSNVLVKSGWTAKIADLSTAVQQNLNEYFRGLEPVGTPLFMAPEVYQRQAYSRSIDVFSWAITMSEILSGNQPYFEDVENGQWEKIMPAICNGDKRPSLPKNLPEQLTRLIKTAWHADGTKREAWFEDIVNGLKPLLPTNLSTLVWPDLSEKKQTEQHQKSEKATPSPRKHRRASHSTSKIKRSATVNDALSETTTSEQRREHLTSSGTSLRRGSLYPQENNKFVGEFLRFSWDVNNRSLYHKRK